MKTLEKVERRLGERLFIKGDRCVGPKCALLRRATPPGVHGARVRGGRRGRSEFGVLLSEKQKVRFLYGLDDHNMERYSKKASMLRGIYSANLIVLLETRLDNVVYRLGFADSRRMARFLVSHGHITVNNRGVTIPSYALKKGDLVGIQPSSLLRPLFTGIEQKLAKTKVPQWLSLDPAKKVGNVVALPHVEDFDCTVDVMKIKEFYSR